MTVAEALGVDCRSCGASLNIEPHLRTARCPFCGSTSIVDRPETKDRPDPDYALAFVIDQGRAEERARRWLRTRGPFARSGLAKASLHEIRGIYLPAYLYGAVANSTYRASIGENYTVTETYTTTDSKGRTQVRTRTRIETEWRTLTGSHSCYLLDVLVTASSGLPEDELEAVEPFDLRALLRFRPEMLSGWIAEEASISHEDCLAAAHVEGVEKVGVELGRFMPGDSHRDLDHRTDLTNEVLDLILLPVWILVARYDEGQPPVRIVVNGQTGEVHGRVPLSKVKIAATVLMVLAFLAICGLVAASR